MKKKELIHFYSQTCSPRLKYINNVVFGSLLGLELAYYEDEQEFEAIKGPKINYSLLKIQNCLNISPASFLFETSIDQQKPPTSSLNDIPVLFPTDDGDFSFDPLAACFYVVSRYEEYDNTQLDNHQRFSAASSLQTELQCIHLPIAQLWTRILKEKIAQKYPSIQFVEPSYHFIPSYDIDMAWSYKEKGWYRTLGAWIKNLGQLDINTLQERWQVTLNKKPDPFDTFEYIAAQNQKYNLAPLYFILLAKHSQYDKNIPPSNKNFIQLIQDIASTNTVGIHPSYYSKTFLAEEIKSLQTILNRSIEHSRQHYVRLNLPETYRHLIAQNIRADYSMGYPDKLGFRNGLAIPVLWYDLQQEKTSALMVHPFQMMDVTLKNYLQLSPAQATEQIHQIVDTIRAYGGDCISIWHNSSFDKQWAGWQKVYEEMLSYAS